MDSKSYKPYGLALLDCFNGDTSAKVMICRDDGAKREHLLREYFRQASDFLPMEKTALHLCRGRILDVGAGAGPHSLVLQDQGQYVCAIDISPEACEIMRRRGVKDVRCVDIRDFEAEPFDTVLILGRGIGMVETLPGLDRFLNDVHKLVNPGGQILLNSYDVRYMAGVKHLAYQKANRQAGRYIGESRSQFEYKGQRGPFWGWLHVDLETLAGHALKAAWSCEVIIQEEDGNYLAQLS